MGDRIQPGAIAGAAGSVVSQGAAIAMGVQDKFSWNAVALSALGSGVSAGLSQVGPLAAIKGWEGAALRGMASNAITQGVGVATGMQDKFSWAGVAVAGVVSGVGYAVADAIGGMFGGNPSRLESLAIDGASNLAGGIAGAAALSLIEGSDFGDNMMAVLPDVIGATVGNMIAGGVSARGSTGRKDEKASGALDFLGDAAGALGDFLGFDGRFGYQGAEGRELSLGGIGQAFQSIGDEEGRLYKAPPIIPVDVKELAPAYLRPGTFTSWPGQQPGVDFSKTSDTFMVPDGRYYRKASADDITHIMMLDKGEVHDAMAPWEIIGPGEVAGIVKMGAAGVSAIARAGAREGVEAAAEQGGLNLFKWGADTTTKPGGWKEGDFMLNLPDRGSPQANWAQNAGRLREQMGQGKPIFDSYRDPVTGLQIPSRGFLGAERNLLETRGWIYDSATGAYHPPVP